MLEHVYAAGEWRRLGNIAAPIRFTWREFGSVPRERLIPRSEWKHLVDQVGRDSECGQLPPVTNQQDVGQCFPAGTLIRMANGSEKPIEKIQVLDEVLTAEGNIKPVLRVIARKATSLLRVQAWGSRHLRCTEEHPILTQRGYVPAGQLTREDWLAMPRFAPQFVQVIQPAEYMPARVYANRNKSKSVSAVRGRKATTMVRTPVPDAITLDKEFGWLIGMFLAEGFTGHGKAEWGLNVNETDTHAARIIRILKERFDADAVIRNVSGKATNAIKVTVYGTQWAHLFEALCATGCGNKHLHPELASGPKEFLEGVLDGWTDGDGLGSNHNGGITVSHSLALSMYDIATFLGLRPTIETLDVKTYGQVASRRKRYVVKWGNHHETRDDWRSRQDDRYVWRKVDGILYESFDGYVFNLEVADDHSYVAEGVGVHNCNANATISAMEYSRKIQGLAYVQLSPADLYHQINGGRDQGSLLEDGIKAAMEVGVGTVADCGSDVWKRGYRPATKEQRAKYRVLEAVLCPTFDHCASAVLHGFGLISGIMWYQNYEPGQDGWLPPGRGGSGGHAIFGYKLTYRNDGREWGIWHQNSWGERWGQRGRFVIPESAYSGPVGGWWAVCQVVTEQGDLPPLAKEES